MSTETDFLADAMLGVKIAYLLRHDQQRSFAEWLLEQTRAPRGPAAAVFDLVRDAYRGLQERKHNLDEEAVARLRTAVEASKYAAILMMDIDLDDLEDTWSIEEDSRELVARRWRDLLGRSPSGYSLPPSHDNVRRLWPALTRSPAAEPLFTLLDDVPAFALSILSALNECFRDVPEDRSPAGHPRRFDNTRVGSTSLIREAASFRSPRYREDVVGYDVRVSRMRMKATMNGFLRACEEADGAPIDLQTFARNNNGDLAGMVAFGTLLAHDHQLRIKPANALVTSVGIDFDLLERRTGELLRSMTLPIWNLPLQHQQSLTLAHHAARAMIAFLDDRPLSPA